MIVCDKDNSLILTGNGDVVDSDDGILAIGSGGNFALSAARALNSVADKADLGAEEIAREAMKVAGDVCVYTNHNLTIETIDLA